MYNKMLKKIALTTLTFAMVLGSTTLVAFAKSEDTEQNIEEVDEESASVINDELEEESQEIFVEKDSEVAELESDNKEAKENIEINKDNENEEQYYIKDPVLRGIINEKLYKDENHNPTPVEMESISFLKIAPSAGFGFNSKHFLKIDSFEGFEYLVNLQYLTIQNTIMDESAIEEISNAGSLVSLYIEYSFFTGKNDVSTTLVNTSINGEPRTDIDLSFSSYVSLEPISNLNNLQQIQLVRNGSINNRTEFGKALTGYDLTGWEKLTSLDYIWIEGASSFNDNSLEFIKDLPDLKEVTLYNTSLNSLESFGNLNEETMRALQLMSNDVLDYTPVIDKKYYLGSSMNVVKDILEFYTEEEIDGNTVKLLSVNTGIHITDNLEGVTLTSESMFRNSMEYLGYENIDGILYLNFKIKDLLNFKYASLDERYHGFMVTVDLRFATPNGARNLEFDLPINVGKRVDFILFDNNVEQRFFKPFDVISPIDTPVRSGYKFVEWTEDEEGMLPFDFSKETFDNQVIYAQWEKIDTFKVTFDSHGGTELASLEGIEEGSLINEPIAPTKDGYVFAGWYKEKELDNKWNFESDRVNEDITLHAKWDSVYLDKMYNLDAGDGVINLSDLMNITNNKDLEAKIIEATHAKGYKIDRDGTQTELPVYVKNLDDIIKSKDENDKDVVLTLVDPQSRLLSSDDINEVDLTVKLHINNDIEIGNKPISPEDTNSTDKPAIPNENNSVNNPSTGINNMNYYYLVTLASSGIIMFVLLKKKKNKI